MPIFWYTDASIRYLPMERDCECIQTCLAVHSQYQLAKKWAKIWKSATGFSHSSDLQNGACCFHQQTKLQFDKHRQGLQWTQFIVFKHLFSLLLFLCYNSPFSTPQAQVACGPGCTTYFEHCLHETLKQGHTTLSPTKVKKSKLVFLCDKLY